MSWVEDRFGVEVRGADGLVELALRRNPRRAHLLVSTVLGKHIPTDPRVVHDAGLRLGRAVAAVVEPALVIGYAETATGLGHCVAEALGAHYLHSTRRVVDSVGDERGVRGAAQPRDGASAVARGSGRARPSRPDRARRRRALDRRDRAQHDRRAAAVVPAPAVRDRRAGRPALGRRSRRDGSARRRARHGDRRGRARARQRELAAGLPAPRGRVRRRLRAAAPRRSSDRQR